MNAVSLSIPSEDSWLLGRLSRIITGRLVYGADTPDSRRSLLRALFALQRLPSVDSNLSISICAGRHNLAFSRDSFGFSSYDYGRTEFYIQYFGDSSQCIHWYDALEGEEKRHAVESRLEEFEAEMQEPGRVTIEDYSVAGHVDEPPLDANAYCRNGGEIS